MQQAQPQPEDREFKRAKVDLEFTFSGPTGSSSFNSSGTSTVNPTVEFDMVVLPYQPFSNKNSSRVDWIDSYLTGELLFMTDVPLADTNRSRIYANYVLNLPQFNYVLALHSIGGNNTLSKSVKDAGFHNLFNLAGVSITDKKDPAGVVKTTELLKPKVFNIAQKKYTTIFNEWENNVKPSTHLFFVLIKREIKQDEELNYMLDINKETNIRTAIKRGDHLYECLPMVSHHRYPTVYDILHPDGKITSIRKFYDAEKVKVLKIFYVGQTVTVYNKEKTAGFPLGRGYKGRARNQIAVNVHANTIDMRCINEIIHGGPSGMAMTEEGEMEWPPRGKEGEEGEKEKKGEGGEVKPTRPFKYDDEEVAARYRKITEGNGSAIFIRLSEKLKQNKALEKLVRPGDDLLSAFNDYIEHIRRKFKEYDLSTQNLFRMLQDKSPAFQKTTDFEDEKLYDNILILHIEYIIKGNKEKVRLDVGYQKYTDFLTKNLSKRDEELLEEATLFPEDKEQREQAKKEDKNAGLEGEKEEDEKSVGSLSSEEEPVLPTPTQEVSTGKTKVVEEEEESEYSESGSESDEDSESGLSA